MKIIVSILLAVALLNCQLFAGDVHSNNQNKKSDPQPESIVGIVAVVVIISIAVIGTTVIIKASKKIPDGDVPTTLVLYKSTDHSNWTPIATNTVTLNNQEWQDVFSVNMTDNTAFYKVKPL